MIPLCVCTTAKAQTILRICAGASQPLIFAYARNIYLNMHAQLSSGAGDLNFDWSLFYYDPTLCVRQRKLRRDCIFAQARPSLRCSHMRKNISLNMHAQLSSGAGCLKFGLCSCSVSTRSEGSDMTADSHNLC